MKTGQVEIEVLWNSNKDAQLVALSLWRQAQHHYERGNLKLGDLICSMFDTILNQFNIPRVRRFVY